MPNLSDDPKARRAEETVVAHVEEHGVHIVNVAEDELGPGFAYTVGLVPRRGHPEIIVFGLPQPVAHQLLNDAAELVKRGHRFQSGTESYELLRDYPCGFRAVPERHHRAFLGWAQWFNDYRTLSAVQLFYPDRDGRWPWDATVAKEFAVRQPILENEDVPDWA